MTLSTGFGFSHVPVGIGPGNDTFSGQPGQLPAQEPGYVQDEYAVVLISGIHQVNGTSLNQVTGTKKHRLRKYDLTELVTSITLTDSFSAPAYQLDLEFENPGVVSHPGGPRQVNATDNLNLLVKNGMAIQVFGSKRLPDGAFQPLVKLSGGGYSWRNELYRGIIFDKSKTGSSTSKTLSITCYDKMIYLANNDFDFTFKNQTATQIIRTLCAKFHLSVAPLGPNFVNTEVVLPRLISFGQSVFDTCYLALQRTRGISGKRYLLHVEDGVVTLRERTHIGASPHWDYAWQFDVRHNVTDVQHGESIENLVTRVQLGTTGRFGRKTVGTFYADHKLERLYGVFQKVDDTRYHVPKHAIAAAQKYLLEHGHPDESITVTGPCVSSIRAGDVAKVVDADEELQGAFYVEGVTHTVTSTTTTSSLTLTRLITEADVQPVIENIPEFFRHVRYLTEYGTNNKPIKFRVRAGIFHPHGMIAGSDYTGDETVIEVSKHFAYLVGTHVRIKLNHLSIQCSVISVVDTPYDLLLSTGAANRINMVRGESVLLYPLRAVYSQGGGNVLGPGTGRQVLASTFGGPHDPSTHGDLGYKNEHMHAEFLKGNNSYAELSNGTALGGLPHLAKLRITYGDRSVIAEKRDIGAGGPNHPKIDLWWETARALGFPEPGLAKVRIERIH